MDRAHVRDVERQLLLGVDQMHDRPPRRVPDRKLVEHVRVVVAQVGHNQIRVDDRGQNLT